MLERSVGEEPASEITWADGALRLLARAGRMLGAPVELEDALRTLSRLLVPDLADTCTIYLRDVGGGVTQVTVMHRVPELELRARELLRRYPPDIHHPGSPLGRVLAEGVPLFLPEAPATWPRELAVDEEHRALIQAQGLRSAMVVPLRVRGEVLGTIAVGITESDRIYDTQDLALLTEVADRAALVVERARLFEAERAARARAQRATEYARRLLAFAAELGGALDGEAVARLVVHHGMAITGAAAGFCARLRPGTDVLEIEHAHGLSSEVVPSAGLLPLAASIPAADAVRARAPIYLRSREERRERYPHLPHFHEALGDGAFVVVPQLLEGAVFGVVAYCFRDARDFDAEVRTLLLTIAHLAAQAHARVGAVEALAERERELEALAEGLPDVVFRLDRDRRHTYVNPAVEHAIGRVPADFVGRTNAEIGYPPEILVVWDRALDEVFATGRPQEIEFEYPMPRGPTIFQTRLVPELGPDGAVASVLGIARDVTQERQLEHAERHAQKMEAVGRLAGGVAHEVNNLMTAIQGFADLLLLDAELGPSARDDLIEIQGTAQRAARLTSQLLAFSRQQASVPEVTTLNQIVATAAGALQEVLPRGVTLVLPPQEGASAIRADPVQMRQVLVQLARNACEAMPLGGEFVLLTDRVRFEVPHREPRSGALIPAGAYSRLRVSDTGCGMDAATLARAFEPFFTTRPLGESLGLGLATVYGIVKQHGGYVWAESVEGEGTTIVVLLPEIEG
jgi:PAS domain S-box-containing protein